MTASRMLLYSSNVLCKCRTYRHEPVCLSSKMIYGCQTWSFTKALEKKLETSLRAMEGEILNVKLKDSAHNTIRQRTRVTDIVKHVRNAKWKWAGHIARMKDNR